MPPKSNPPLANPYNNRKVNMADQSLDEGLCKICLIEKIEVVCIPCGHRCICQMCADNLKKTKKLCPICRT